jgi:hypothetical protein
LKKFPLKTILTIALLIGGVGIAIATGFTWASAASPSKYYQVVPSGGRLSAGDRVTSATVRGRYYYLSYQGDGNLVLYQNNGEVLWASHTAGTTAGEVVMQQDGNLVVYNRGGRAVWASGTASHPGSHLEVQVDGNVVIYNPQHHPQWSTNGSRVQPKPPVHSKVPVHPKQPVHSKPTPTPTPIPPTPTPPPCKHAKPCADF